MCPATSNAAGVRVPVTPSSESRCNVGPCSSCNCATALTPSTYRPHVLGQRLASGAQYTADDDARQTEVTL